MDGCGFDSRHLHQHAIYPLIAVVPSLDKLHLYHYNSTITKYFDGTYRSMSNDFILNSDIISVFEKNGVVLLKNMIDNKWQRIILDAIEEDIKKPSPFFHAYETEEGKGKFHGNLRIWEHYEGL